LNAAIELTLVIAALSVTLPLRLAPAIGLVMVIEGIGAIEVSEKSDVVKSRRH